jgi:hypothetical protein
MADTDETNPPATDAEIQRRTSFADAVLGAGCDEVTDPTLRELRRRAILGGITTEAAIAAGLAHVDAGNPERNSVS